MVTETQDGGRDTTNHLTDSVRSRRETEGEGGMNGGQEAAMEDLSALPSEMIFDSVTETPDLQTQSQEAQGPPNGHSGTDQSGQSSGNVAMDTAGSKVKPGAAGEQGKLGVKQNKKEDKQKQLV